MTFGGGVQGVVCQVICQSFDPLFTISIGEKKDESGWPVTLYKNQWLILLAAAERIKEFIKNYDFLTIAPWSGFALPSSCGDL